MRNSHDCIDSMWMSALGDLFTHGTRSPSRQGSTIEVVGWSATLQDPQRNFLLNERRAIDPCYACAELLWYLSRRDDTAMIEAYAPQYEQFAEPPGSEHGAPNYHRAYGAYGKRIAGNIAGIDQLELVVDRLKNQPKDRQVVVTLWRPDDLIPSNVRDKPCTVCLQYKIGGGKLHALTYMRSNDVWLGMPYDAFCFSCLQMLVAASVGVPPGPYHHHVGSMHLYEKNEKAAREAYRAGLGRTPDHTRHGWNDNDRIDDVPYYVNFEAAIRTVQYAEGYLKNLVTTGGSVLSDALRCCAKKFCNNWLDPVSPLLRKGLETYANHRRAGSRGQDDAGKGADQAAQ